MATISATEARSLFTKQLVAIYKERTAPTSFLRSFFKTVESNSKLISIEVQRGSEKIAVDVERGTEGNRNTFDKSSEKIFLPPYYREYFDMTDLDFYDRLFSENGVVDGSDFSAWLKMVVEKLGMLQDKIERAYEVQCSQVLLTGIVQLEKGTNINFKRKAASLVDLGASQYFANATSDPYKSLGDGATFIRTKGKTATNIYNVIMGQQVLRDFLDNPKVKERADLRRISLDTIRQPQREQSGGVLHGEVSADAYVFRIWTYPEFHDTKAALNVDYMDTKKFVILPENPRFVLSFAGVPQLIGKSADVGAGLATRKGAFLISEYLDQRAAAHIVDIKSAGVAIPVAVDQVYTAQAVS